MITEPLACWMIDYRNREHGWCFTTEIFPADMLPGCGRLENGGNLVSMWFELKPKGVGVVSTLLLGNWANFDALC